MFNKIIPKKSTAIKEMPISIKLILSNKIFRKIKSFHEKVK